MTPDQEADQRHDRERLRPALLDQPPEVGGPVARVAPDQPNAPHRHLADEREGLASLGDESEGVRAQPLDQWWPGGVLAGAGALGHGDREVQKVAQPGGQRRGVERDPALAAGLADPGEKGQDAAVPGAQPGDVERHSRRRRLAPQLRFQRGHRGKAAHQVPASAEANHQRLALDPVQPDLVHGPALGCAGDARRRRAGAGTRPGRHSQGRSRAER